MTKTYLMIVIHHKAAITSTFREREEKLATNVR